MLLVPWQSWILSRVRLASFVYAYTLLKHLILEVYFHRWVDCVFSQCIDLPYLVSAITCFSLPGLSIGVILYSGKVCPCCEAPSRLLMQPAQVCGSFLQPLLSPRPSELSKCITMPKTAVLTWDLASSQYSLCIRISVDFKFCPFLSGSVGLRCPNRYLRRFLCPLPEIYADIFLAVGTSWTLLSYI